MEKPSWMEQFLRSQETRRDGSGLPPEAIPFGPPPAQHTNLHRPAYWRTDLSGHPNARFNLCYTEKAPHPSQRLHLIYPEDFSLETDAPLPVVIFVHGGGFCGGNTEDDGRSVLYTAEGAIHVLRFGYALALVDYRMLPEFEIMDAIHDVKAVIRYLRANAATLGLDAEHIALFGESAGGYLVDIVGVTGDNPDFEDPGMGHPGISTKVSAVVSWYSLCEIGHRLDLFFHNRHDAITRAALRFFLNPIHHVDAATPPFLLQHGVCDTEVDPDNSIRLYNRLCAVTGDEENELELIEGADHAVRWFITPENGERIVRWLDLFMKP